MPTTFHFELVSPDKVLFNGSAQAVLVPGAEGDFQVLSDHAPVMTAMRRRSRRNRRRRRQAQSRVRARRFCRRE